MVENTASSIPASQESPLTTGSNVLGGLAAPPRCPAEQHSRNQSRACRSKESGARSQNRARVAVQQAADLFQRGQQFIRLPISKVSRKNQVVSAFLHGTLGDIHVTRLVW